MWEYFTVRLDLFWMLHIKMRWFWVVCSWQLQFILLLPVCFAQMRPLVYHIEEERPSDTLIADLKHDSGLQFKYRDQTDLLDQIQFEFASLPGQHWEYFYIERSTGVLRTAISIDREVLCPRSTDCKVDINVVTQPSQFFQIIKVTINIIDINDNEPTFPERALLLDISESTLPGRAFPVPSAEDPDSGNFGVQYYELQPPSPFFALQITNETDGTSDVHLVLQKSLDREIRDTYVMNIIAYDGGQVALSGFLEVRVTVVDSNDNSPQFPNDTYEVSVEETVPLGWVLIRLWANDPDIGENGLITFSLEDLADPGANHTFAIDPDTGSVYTQSLLDYETRNKYQLSVVARDHGHTSLTAYAKLLIHILDVNDHPPTITVNTLTDNGVAQVLESAAIGTFVSHVSVSDQDEGINGEFNCDIGSESNTFSLKQLYDTEFKIETTIKVDRESQEYYNITLVCSDGGNPSLTSTTYVPVRIMDINDNEPMFTQDVYNVKILENSLPGTNVIKLNATDPDEGLNSELWFSIEKNDAPGTFAIDRGDGKILVTGELDYETRRFYEMTVAVHDQGDPSLSSTAVVKISVGDVNDQHPVFLEEIYSFSLEENLPAKTVVGQVVAVDGDSSVYSRITYMVDTGGATNIFDVDPITGQIFTLQPLDREVQEVHQLKVMAVNSDLPHMKGSVDVLISVIDKNDNSPIFIFPSDTNNTVNVSNLVPKGDVIGQIISTDLDLGENAYVTYDLLNQTSADLFTIDSETGEIFVKNSLSGITYGLYHMVIVAQDSGHPVHISTSKLTILVDQTIAYVDISASGWAFEHRDMLLAASIAPVLVLLCIILVLFLIRRRHIKADNARRYNCRLEAQKKALEAAQRSNRTTPEKPLKYRISGISIGESSTDDVISENNANKDTDTIMRSKSSHISTEDKSRDSGIVCPMQAGNKSKDVTSDLGSTSDPNLTPRPGESPNLDTTLEKIQTEVQKIIQMQGQEVMSDDDSLTDSGRGPSEEGEHNITTKGSPSSSGTCVMPTVHNANGANYPSRVTPLPSNKNYSGKSPNNLTVPNDKFQLRHPRTPPQGNCDMHYHNNQAGPPQSPHRYRHRHSSDCESYQNQDFLKPYQASSPRRQVSDSSPALKWAYAKGYHRDYDQDHSYHQDPQYYNISPPASSPYHDNCHNQDWNCNKYGSPHDGNVACVTQNPVQRCVRDVVNHYLPDRSNSRDEESAADVSDGDTTTSGSYVVDPLEYEVEPRRNHHALPHNNDCIDRTVGIHQDPGQQSDYLYI